MKRGKAVSAREKALQIITAVETRSSFSDKLLEKAVVEQPWDARDRALLVELVKGTLRWRGRLDWILRQLVKVSFDTLSPHARNILRLGLFQILFLHKVPDFAATSESVKLAGRYTSRPVAGLVNAVLRRGAQRAEGFEFPRVSEDPPKAISSFWSMPEWIVVRWIERLGVPETAALCCQMNQVEKISLRVNRNWGSREKLMKALSGEGFEAEPGALSKDVVNVSPHFSPRLSRSFAEGAATVQDESEVLASELLGVAPGERVLDACAGPGTKSTYFAALAGEEGLVVCLEIQKQRARRIADHARRLGMENIVVIVADSRRMPLSSKFPRVCVDAPCSGLGILGKRADARWRKRESLIGEMAQLQLELLRSAAEVVDSGGVLVYSVCSTEVEEGEEVIGNFLETNSEFEIEDAAGFLPGSVVEKGMMRTWPHKHGTDGAFASRLRRVSGGEG